MLMLLVKDFLLLRSFITSFITYVSDRGCISTLVDVCPIVHFLDFMNMR